jgi:uncharacterized iron-regulated protein
MRLEPGLLLAALLVATPAARAEPLPPTILSQPAAHTLTGKIWLPGQGFISSDELARRAAAADVLLLGESHDNPDHHALQAWVLGQVLAAGKRPLVAFEMIDAGQSVALASHLATHPRDAAGLGPALGWDKSGWPDWNFYRPIAEAALTAGTSLAAGNLGKDETRAIAKGEVPARLAALGLDRPLDAATRQGMEAEIKAGHCDLLPDRALPAMVRVQRARDAHMARVLADGIAAHGSAVLIAGSGHVRIDRAVPAHLTVMAPGKRVFAIAFAEVQPGMTEPVAYGEGYDADAPPFHALWFTPRAERENQCEVMRKHMEKKKD